MDKQVLSDKRFKIIIRDGRKYVKDLVFSAANSPGTEAPVPLFDMVYVNVPEPSTLLLNRFYTREFFADLSRVLTPGGVMALKINTDETPIANLYFNKIIGWYGKSNISNILGFFQKVKLRDVIFIILVLFLFRFIRIVTAL